MRKQTIKSTLEKMNGKAVRYEYVTDANIINTIDGIFRVKTNGVIFEYPGDNATEMYGSKPKQANCKLLENGYLRYMKDYNRETKQYEKSESTFIRYTIIEDTAAVEKLRQKIDDARLAIQQRRENKRQAEEKKKQEAATAKLAAELEAFRNGKSNNYIVEYILQNMQDDYKQLKAVEKAKLSRYRVEIYDNEFGFYESFKCYDYKRNVEELNQNPAGNLILQATHKALPEYLPELPKQLIEFTQDEIEMLKKLFPSKIEKRTYRRHQTLREYHARLSNAGINVNESSGFFTKQGFTFYYESKYNRYYERTGYKNSVMILRETPDDRKQNIMMSLECCNIANKDDNDFENSFTGCDKFNDYKIIVNETVEIYKNHKLIQSIDYSNSYSFDVWGVVRSTMAQHYESELQTVETA